MVVVVSGFLLVLEILFLYLELPLLLCPNLDPVAELSECWLAPTSKSGAEVVVVVVVVAEALLLWRFRNLKSLNGPLASDPTFPIYYSMCVP